MNSNYQIHFNDTWFNSYIENFRIEKDSILEIKDEYNHYLPLEFRKEKRWKIFTKNRLFPLAHGPNDFFLLKKGNTSPEKSAEYYAESLYQIRKKWDSIHLRYIPEKSEVWPFFVQFMISKGYRVDVLKNRHYYFINTSSDWEEYYLSFLHKSLRDVRGRLNRLKTDNLSYEIKVVKTNINQYLPELLNLYDERRKSTEQANAFNKTEHRKMLIDVINKYEKLGWVQLSYFLGSDSKIWAYQLDFIKDGIQYHYTPAFDEQYKYYSPSKILLFESIKMAFFNPDIREFNFMRGESAYKTQYARERENYVFIEISNSFSFINRFDLLLNSSI